MQSRVVELPCDPAQVASFVVGSVTVNVVYLHVLNVIAFMKRLADGSSNVDKHSLVVITAFPSVHIGVLQVAS